MKATERVGLLVVAVLVALTIHLTLLGVLDSFKASLAITASSLLAAYSLVNKPTGKKALSRLLLYSSLIAFFMVYAAFFSNPELVMAASAEYDPCSQDSDCNSDNCVYNYTGGSGSTGDPEKICCDAGQCAMSYGGPPPDTTCIDDEQCASVAVGLTYGYFPVGCILETSDETLRACGCVHSEDTGDDTAWDSTNSRCCAGLSDDWLFGDDASKGCDDGDPVTCGSGTACTFIDGSNDYYCDGSSWVESSTAKGEECNNGPVCTDDDGTCCSSSLVKDTSTGDFTCGCTVSEMGYACDSVVGGGTFTQDRMCLHHIVNNDYRCYDTMASYYEGKYLSDCLYYNLEITYGAPCDTTNTDGNFDANGICYGQTDCCTDDYVDGDNDGTFDDDDCGCGSGRDGKTCDDNVDKTWDGVCAYTGASWTCDTSDVYYDGSDYRTSASSSTDGYRCMTGSVGSGGFSQEGLGAESTCETSGFVCKSGESYYSYANRTSCSEGNECDESLANGDFSAGSKRYDPDDDVCDDCTDGLGEDGNCEAGCAGDASADELTPSACDGTAAYVTSACVYQDSSETSQQSCGCISGTGKDDSNRWDSTNSRCCDGSDDWVFGDDSSKACDAGGVTTCDAGATGGRIDLGGTGYYCDGSVWQEQKANTNSCSNGYECVSNNCIINHGGSGSICCSSNSCAYSGSCYGDGGVSQCGFVDPETFFGDVCTGSSNSWSDDTTTCRSSAYAGDCTASSICNDVSPSTVKTACSGYGQTYFADTCSTSCAAGDDTGTCRSSAYDGSCTGDASANGLTPSTCNSTHGYVTSSCAYHTADESQEGCGCVTAGDSSSTTNWDSTNTRCCEGSDDWVFGDDSSKACDDGTVKTCGSGTVCDTIDVGTTHYCNGDSWVESTAKGQACNINGVCTADNGACCGDDGVEDVVYDGTNYYCDCTSARDGYACEDSNGDAGGSYNQEGACATSDEGTTWVCDTDASDVASTGTYNATDCYVSSTYNYISNSCDSLGNSGGVVSYDGVCFNQTGTTWNCCTSYATNSTLIDDPDECGNEGSVCGTGSDGLKCDDVSDASWSPRDKRCDESQTSCTTCTFTSSVDESGACESGCGASATCDEKTLETLGADSTYCCHDCTNPDNTLYSGVVWADCDYNSNTGSSDYCFDTSADQCYHQSGDSCVTTGWSFTQSSCPNPRYKDQTGSWHNNSYCTSDCADSGTSCYYETSADTPTDRSDDCDSTGCLVSSCEMSEGFLCQATTGCTCDDTECAADARRDGYESGACFDGACDYEPKVDSHSVSPETVYYNDNVEFTATVSSYDDDINKAEVWAVVKESGEPTADEYNAYEMSCTGGDCSYTHNFTTLGTGYYYVNVTDNNSQSNTTSTANWYQESLTVDYLNYTRTGYYPDDHVDYGEDLVVEGHLKNDRTGGDESGVSVTVKVINSTHQVDQGTTCTSTTDGTGNFTCTMTSIALTKPGDYDLKVLNEEVSNANSVKNDENTSKAFKEYEPITYTNSFWGNPNEFHLQTTADYQYTSTPVECTDCGNYTLTDADSGTHEYSFTTDSSGFNDSTITDTPLKPGDNSFTAFIEHYGNGTSDPATITVNGTVYSVTLNDTVLSNEGDAVTVTASVNNTGNINLSNVWGATKVYHGEDNLEPYGSPETEALQTGSTDSYVGDVNPESTLELTYTFPINDSLPVGTYGLLSYFGDTNTGSESWENRVGANQSSTTWNDLTPRFYVYNFTGTHGAVNDPVRLTRQTIHINPYLNTGYDNNQSCHVKEDCTIRLNVTQDDENDVYADNVLMTWNSTSSRYDYSFWPNLCEDNNYTIIVNDTSGVESTFTGTYYFNCTLGIRALTYRQPSDSEDVALFEGDFIDKNKGLITFYLEAFDPSGEENMDFVSWNITNVDTGEVYTEFNGTCTNTSAKEWRCSQTLDPEEAGCHELSSDMYVQGTDSSRNNSRSINFYVDSIEASFDYDESVLVGSDQEVAGQISYCSGKTYGNYSNVTVDITTPTSTETKKSETPTPTGRIYSTYTPDIEGAKNLLVEVSDNNLERGFTLSFSDLISISKTGLSVTPLKEHFNLGREGQRAYAYTITNPSSKPMTYSLEMVSSSVPVLFSSNLDSDKNVTVSGGEDYTGYLDVLPVMIGEYTATLNLQNQDFSFDNTSAEVSSDVSVRYQQVGFHYTLVPGLTPVFVILLCLAASLALWLK